MSASTNTEKKTFQSTNAEEHIRRIHERKYLVPAGFYRVFYTPNVTLHERQDVAAVLAQASKEYEAHKATFTVLGPGEYTLDTRVWRAMSHKALGMAGKVFKTESKHEPNHIAQNAIEFARAMSMSSMLAAQAQLTVQQVPLCALCVVVYVCECASVQVQHLLY
jgi:hypothetical protein